MNHPPTFLPDFGIRSAPPCGDCYDDGHCSMNCGPAIKSESLPRQTAKAFSEIVCRHSQHGKQAQ